MHKSTSCHRNINTDSSIHNNTDLISDFLHLVWQLQACNPLACHMQQSLFRPAVIPIHSIHSRHKVWVWGCVAVQLLSSWTQRNGNMQKLANTLHRRNQRVPSVDQMSKYTVCSAQCLLWSSFSSRIQQNIKTSWVRHHVFHVQQTILQSSSNTPFCKVLWQLQETETLMVIVGPSRKGHPHAQTQRAHLSSRGASTQQCHPDALAADKASIPQWAGVLMHAIHVHCVLIVQLELCTVIVMLGWT